MSRRVVGYTGEGRARTPVYAPEGPARARVAGYVAQSASRGYAAIGGTLVTGSSGAGSKGAEYQARHRAKKRAAA